MEPNGTGAGALAEHAARMNRVIEYIDTHLNEELSLATLADVAAYSKFHFHRIFRASAGEPIAEYILRRRLEKAAYRLLVDTGRSITDIAAGCGFSGPAVFAKNFRARFGMTASEWRRAEPTARKGRGPDRREEGSRDRRDARVSVAYGPTPIWTARWPGGERTVRLEAVPEMTLAYLRYSGPYKGDGALFEGLFKRLFAWLGPRGLVRPETSKTIVVYHEYPDITTDDRLRLSACCTVPPTTAGDGEIGIMPFSPGLCAVSRFACAPDEYQGAWDWMYETWLPESGFLPADAPAFERYGFDAYDAATGKTTVDICVPLMAK